MLQADSYGQAAVLCFVVDGGRVLLIEKLRGLGAGKVNAPGGKVEPGETALAAAVRETQEEVLVTPVDPVLRARLGFRFADGYSLYVEAFVAHSHRGVPGPSPEALPFWCPLDAIPYDRMWADDKLWLPQALAGRLVEGAFDFDGDRMLSHQVSSKP